MKNNIIDIPDFDSWVNCVKILRHGKWSNYNKAAAAAKCSKRLPQALKEIGWIKKNNGVYNWYGPDTMDDEAWAVVRKQEQEIKDRALIHYKSDEIQKEFDFSRLDKNEKITLFENLVNALKSDGLELDYTGGDLRLIEKRIHKINIK